MLFRITKQVAPFMSTERGNLARLPFQRLGTEQQKRDNKHNSQGFYLKTNTSTAQTR